MATVPEITARPLSGHHHIDALLGAMPWNYTGRTSISFSFQLDTSTDHGGQLFEAGTRTAFNGVQQFQVRTILAYITQVTGIAFTEVPLAASADLHFANADLKDGYTSQNDAQVSYSTVGGQVTQLSIDAWVYLDIFDDAFDNQNPQPGGSGYEALLHEIGHTLGLKHPSEGEQQLSPGDAPGQDNSATTLMSFNSVGGPYTAFRDFDLAALQWLYGSDGLGGAFGVGSPNVSLRGSQAAERLVGGAGNDRLEGLQGNDTIDGGAGTDTAAYGSPRSAYAIQHTAQGHVVTGADGTDTLANVERLVFSDGSRVALDVNGSAGMAYRLYQAAFDRAPDLPGLGYHIRNLDNGVPLAGVSAHFIESPEFQSRYGALDDVAFVRQLYLNVLHREPEAAGLAYHVNNLKTTHARPDVLLGFSESPENKNLLIGVIQDGMAYTA